jgi:hypothetical protein
LLIGLIVDNALGREYEDEHQAAQADEELERRML